MSRVLDREYSSWPRPSAEVFSFFCDAANLETQRVRPGAVIGYQLDFNSPDRGQFHERA